MLLSTTSSLEEGGRKSNVTFSYLLSRGGGEKEECYFLLSPFRSRVGGRVMLLSPIFSPEEGGRKKNVTFWYLLPGGGWERE